MDFGSFYWSLNNVEFKSYVLPSKLWLKFLKIYYICILSINTSPFRESSLEFMKNRCIKFQSMYKLINHSPQFCGYQHSFFILFFLQRQILYQSTYTIIHTFVFGGIILTFDKYITTYRLICQLTHYQTKTFWFFLFMLFFYINYKIIKCDTRIMIWRR